MQNNSVQERSYINDFHRQNSMGAVSEGGRIHVIASLLAGAEVGTDQLTAPEQQNQKVSRKAV